MKKERSESANELRKKTLGRQNILRRKTIDYYPAIYREVRDEEGNIVAYDYLDEETYAQTPVKVEVHQPTVRERNKLINDCRNDQGRLDEMEFILRAAIAFTYDPESGEKLYDATDYEVLSNSPSGDFVDQFGGEAIQMLTLGEAKGKASLKVSDATSNVKQNS